MRRTSRYFNLSLLLTGVIFSFLSLNSCSYKHYKGFNKIPSVNTSFPLIFDTIFSKATYLTDFEVFGNQLSGITIIKKPALSTTFHVVFMSQIGLKYFDIEIALDKQDDWFRVNYIMESLNREFIVNALQADFGLLFAKFPENAQVQWYQHPEMDKKEVTVSYLKEIASYILDNQEVTEAILRKATSVTASIILSKSKTNYPSSLEIENKKARLKISLKEIQM